MGRVCTCSSVDIFVMLVVYCDAPSGMCVHVVVLIYLLVENTKIDVNCRSLINSLDVYYLWDHRYFAGSCIEDNAINVYHMGSGVCVFIHTCCHIVHHIYTYICIWICILCVFMYVCIRYNHITMEYLLVVSKFPYFFLSFF